MWIADAKRMREIDRIAASQFGLSSNELIEQVGESIAASMNANLPADLSFSVICGKGRNGGDGMAVARCLMERGHGVEVILACRESEVRCPEQLVRLREAGAVPTFSDSRGFKDALSQLSEAGMIIDALLGVGAKGAARGPVAQAISAINAAGRFVYSIDVPSGIDCDTGEELGEAIRASITANIGLPKRCLFQGAGLACAGAWHVEEINYPPELLMESTGFLLMSSGFASQLLIPRPIDSHKGNNGHVLIVAGSGSMPGAAVLAARGAVHGGAGLVTVAGVSEVMSAVSAAMPEALLLPLASRDGSILPEASDALLARQETWQSAVFGPGLGQNSSVRAFLHQCWADWSVPSVVDADALTAMAAGVPFPRKCPAVLTPHPGEFSRLMQMSVAEVQSDRFRAASQACRQLDKTVVLKGAKTITTSPGSTSFVNNSGNAGMAAGGMGDVLSGLIGALIAQGHEVERAAALGVHLHGMAGDLCAADIGPVGFTASQVAQMLPRARAKLAECDS